MATQEPNLTSTRQRQPIHFDGRRFFREHIGRSWWLALWLLLLSYVTLVYTTNQFAQAALTTTAVTLVWLATLAATVYSELTHRHRLLTLWLKDNLYSSVTNVLLTLLLTLLIVAAVRGFIGYAFLRASFTTDPDLAKATLAQFSSPGANWGAVIANMRNLMVFRFPRAETWRLFLILGYLAVMLPVSTLVYSQQRLRRSPIRQALNLLWVLTPALTLAILWGVKIAPGAWQNVLVNTAVYLLVFVALFFGSRYLLRRYQSTGLSLALMLVWVAALAAAFWLMVDNFTATLNPDVAWGGLLLTMIIAVFAIVASFPLGVLLALGRRSQIRGVPWWLTALTAGLLTLYLLVNNTFPALADASGLLGTILAFWPLLVLLIAYLFQKYFKGNVVAAFSTVYIESVRGVPLITVLFMSIILFPILLPPGMEILSTWRVMAAAALFAAAYLAENIRGGLQAIPKGQYEAADSIGLNAFQKYRLIILPQAIRIVIPAIVGQFIGLFLDTTLIAIVGLIELLGVANLIAAQTNWLGVRREPYIFLMFVYFFGSWIMVTISRRMERNTER
ncbi:MAG: ABC transporter permease subunit [Chloroflexi bacterium]|nr:ABC transporter permease subunit [Chloroflexota bacterium]